MQRHAAQRSKNTASPHGSVAALGHGGPCPLKSPTVRVLGGKVWGPQPTVSPRQLPTVLSIHFLHHVHDNHRPRVAFTAINSNYDHAPESRWQENSIPRPIFSHLIILYKLLCVPISYFQTQPTGRILNILSPDIGSLRYEDHQRFERCTFVPRQSCRIAALPPLSWQMSFPTSWSRATINRNFGCAVEKSSVSAPFCCHQ